MNNKQKRLFNQSNRILKMFYENNNCDIEISFDGDYLNIVFVNFRAFGWNFLEQVSIDLVENGISWELTTNDKGYLTIRLF